MSDRPPDIRSWTASIASGDPVAFAAFYDAWFDRMLREARRATGRDEAFCLDVVQDAMVRVIRFLRPVDTEPALGAWIRRTVRSCAYDRLRRDLRRARRETARGPAVARRDAAHETPDELAERLSWLRTAMDELDEPTRVMLDLRHRAGWTLRAIAEQLGLTTGAVDGRLRRGLETLRQVRGASDD